MANLTIKGWNIIQHIGFDDLPNHGIGIYSKENDTPIGIDYSIQELTTGLHQVSIDFEQIDGLTFDPIKLVWAIPAINLKGTWLSDYTSDRRVISEFDNERLLVSRAAFEAPVVNLFGHDDSNIHTFACSDAVNPISLGVGLLESNGWVQCNIILFKEKVLDLHNHHIKLLLDYRHCRYEKSLKDVSDWWASMTCYAPMPVPEAAKLPMYSTWYSYNQQMETSILLKECQMAKQMGYETIIVDDGWQTSDNAGLYAYTGDWHPERFPNMKEYVKQTHDLGMKVMLWYAVPFFGINSEVYKRFEGKFLYISEGYETAIVDPRYPEIRAYLIQLYKDAIIDWDLDGLKLDFIDWFIPSVETEFTAENGRDFAAIGPAVIKLMNDIASALQALKPDILIEFRQHYIGPALRKCGNMFRAHDCANDAVTNRRRIVDLRLLTGTSAVHSDMFMWNYDEPTELAALQFVNILFSVPQLSVRLLEVSEEHKAMIAFYTNYWIQNRHILLDGNFSAIGPVENYPIVSSSKSNKLILALYTLQVVEIEKSFQSIDIINGKTSTTLFVCLDNSAQLYHMQVKNCFGEVIKDENHQFSNDLSRFEVPISGILSLERVN